MACEARWAGGDSAANEDSSMRKQRFFEMGMVCLAVLVLSAEAVIAATSAASVSGIDESARSEAAVIAVDQHWGDAELDGDNTYLDQLLLPEYRTVDADGVAHPRSAVARKPASDKDRRTTEAWLKAHPSGKTVVMHGDVAVLSFYNPALGPQRGVRSSDIFVYIDGRWHALYSQHSNAGKG